MDNNKIAVKTSLSVHVEEIKNLSRLIPNLVEDLMDSVTELSYCWQGPEWEEYQKTFSYYMEQLKLKKYKMHFNKWILVLKKYRAMGRIVMRSQCTNLQKMIMNTSFKHCVSMQTSGNQ